MLRGPQAALRALKLFPYFILFFLLFLDDMVVSFLFLSAEGPGVTSATVTSISKGCLKSKFDFQIA